MPLKVVGIPCDWGAGMPGGAAGVEGWYYVGLSYKHLAWLRATHYRLLPSISQPIWIQDQTHLYARRIEYWQGFSQEIQTQLKQLWDPSASYLFLTGDHSWSGCLLPFLCNQVEDLLVVWIDAHADFHTPATTPSGNLHGMPLAMVTGLNNQRFHPVPSETWQRWEALVQPCLQPANLFLVGLRSYEPPENEILETHQIPVFTSEAIHQQGIAPILEAIRTRVTPKTTLYISLDVDVWDPSFARATTSPAPGGLSIGSVRALLHELLSWPQTRFVEVTEINPLLDQGHDTLLYAYGTVRPFIERDPS